MIIMSKYRNIVPLLTVMVGLLLSGETLAVDLELNITSPKASYLVAEPVFIDMILKNINAAVEAPVSAEATVENQYISLFIARSDGAFQKYDPGFHIEPGRPLIKLSPTMSIVNRQLIIYNVSVKDFAFPSEGTYRIKAVYHQFGREPDVESNTLEIQITQPTGAEAEALELFKTREVAELVMNINEDNKAVVNLETLMSRYAQTTYGEYAQYYLARRQTQTFFDRKPDYERAIQLYKDLIKRDPRFNLISEANYRLGIAQMKVGQYENAKQSFNAAIGKSKVSTLIRKARESLKKIEKLQRNE